MISKKQTLFRNASKAIIAFKIIDYLRSSDGYLGGINGLSEKDDEREMRNNDDESGLKWSTEVGNFFSSSYYTPTDC